MSRGTAAALAWAFLAALGGGYDLGQVWLCFGMIVGR